MRFALTAFTASLLVSTAAFAAENTVRSGMNAAPQADAVTLSGTVDKLIDKDTFVLRDANGNKINVSSASALSVKQGDVVTVEGDKSANAGNLEDASVVLGAASASRDMTVAQVIDKKPKPTKEDGSSKNGAASSGNSGMVNANLSSLDNLPEEGTVNLNGTVSRVSGSDSFTLSDANGKTINVHTAASADVKQGDTVSVNGQIGDRLLGFGRQIEDAKVMVIGAK